MSEWPLVVFTIAVQLACGLAAAATLLDRRATDATALRRLGIAIFPVAAFGSLAALLHLGRPGSAWKAGRNFPASPLSIEIVVTLLFLLAALGYSQMWWKQTPRRTVVGIVTGLFGIGAVVSSSLVYLIPAQPAWNSLWVPLSFVGTALLLGGFAVAVVDCGQQTRLLKIGLGGVVGGSVVLLSSAMWSLVHLSGGQGDDFTVMRLRSALHVVTGPWLAGWFGVYLLLTVALPIAYAVRLWPQAGGHCSGKTPAGMLIFLTILVGAVVGRVLMYSVGASIAGF